MSGPAPTRKRPPMGHYRAGHARPLQRDILAIERRYFTNGEPSMKQYDIGIDLGTTSIIIATEEQGVVFRQPTIEIGRAHV